LMYGRRGVVIEVISAVDIALWDIIGKATGQPVYKLVGGKTKEKIRVYATGNNTARHKELGFTAVKPAMPHGPADGELGMRKNEAIVRQVRDILGDEAEIRIDCYMGWDVPYTIEMARRLRDYRITWIEEPVLPDHIDSYLRIKDAVKDILITGGEHEYTRFGFKELIERRAVDVLQPDIYRAGGLTELKRISAWASAYDLPVVPHGVGAPSYHLVMSNVNSPIAEYVDILADGGEWLFTGDVVPEKGYVELSERPGFGYELNEGVIDGRVTPVPVW
jgi:L-rhamnonate dehydratase